MKPANFKVDTSLTSILGENYRSTEAALKELVDNAWDADADSVHITMPEPFEEAEIVLTDTGSGMTEKEIRNEYLFIARSRTSRKGEYTPQKKRRVKGRKGIGKFAGLLVAGEMHLVSKARGKKTSLVIVKDDLLRWKNDLEKLNLAISVEDCGAEERGTTIILKQLNQNLHFPNSTRLSQLLITEYGRENGFDISINGKSIDIEDIFGNSESGSANLNSVGQVKYKYTISENKRNLKQSGIALRVDGKIIGRPTYFGLENDEDVPKKLLKKIYAEVEADGLKEDVTADWGAIFENSKKLQDVQSFLRLKIKDALKETYSQQIAIAEAKLDNKINSELKKLPESKIPAARRTLDKILKNYINESEEKINTVITVVLDTLEQDEYNEALVQIEQAAKKKGRGFATALAQFGQVENSALGVQANYRTNFLAHLEQLIAHKKTNATTIRQVLENNLWVLHEKFGLMAATETLNQISKDYLGSKFEDKKTKKRPEFLLCKDYESNILLIELTKKAEKLESSAQRKGEKYRSALKLLFPNSAISILVLGDTVDSKITANYKENAIILDSYTNVLSKSKARLEWIGK